MLDNISFGDATLDVFLQISAEDADVKCTIKEEVCQICFDYADKIPVESVIKVPGAGNGSNNAVGSSRLGLKSAIVGILGKDSVGREIAAYWKKEGVNTKFVTFDTKRGTNYSTVLNYAGERTILVFHEKRSYVFPKALPKSKWMYYTSLGKGSEVLHKSLVSYVKRNKANLCFQPGTHQLKLGAAALAPIIAASTVTVMNKEEMERVMGDGAKSMSHLLKSLHAMGCKISVITDGMRGAYAYDGSQMLQMDIMDVPVVERTGCGDAFATALIAALQHGKPLSEAMRWGTANSASVLSYIGPQQGLLTMPGMKKYLARFKNIVAKPL